MRTVTPVHTTRRTVGVRVYIAKDVITGVQTVGTNLRIQLTELTRRKKKRQN